MNTKYTFNKDYTANYFNLSNGKNETKTFKKGDVIEGIDVVYPPYVKAIPMVQTTIDGKMPKGNGIVGEVILMIPTDVVDGDKGSSNTATNTTAKKDDYMFMGIAFLVIGGLILYMTNEK